MGPEPLCVDFKFADFLEKLKNRKTKIKPLLLDQTFIAGIGNIYAAETLFLSGINPAHRADTLKNEKAKLLFNNIKEVLRSAIKHRGTSFDQYRDAKGAKGNFVKKLFVYGRAGEMCYHCKKPVSRIVLGGRGTYFCRSCQK